METSLPTNPYQAPETAVADLEAQRADAAPAFAVSITKLVVMNLATVGMYQLYWFYKHWVAIKRRTRENISPVWRTFFSVIWCYSCFSHIHDEARRHKVDNWISVGSLAAGWAITSLLGRLPDPWWMISLGSFLFLIPIQRQANALNAKVAPGADRNERFTWANWLWLGVMGCLWALVLIGLMLPEQAAA